MDDMTIDQPETHSANSVTLQKMMAEQVQPDIFDPPHHKLKPGIQSKLDALLKEYETQFAKDETSIRTTPLMEMTIDTGDSEPILQKPYPIAMKNYQWIREENEKLLTVKVIHSSRSSWSAPIIVVQKGDGGKRLFINYRALKQSYQEIYLAHAKSRGCLLQNWMEPSIFQLWIWELVIILFLWTSLWFQKQHSIPLLASMNMPRYLSDWVRVQHIFKN